MTYQLPSAEEKSYYLQQKFDEIATKYDLFNDLITFGLHRYWKQFVVRQTGVLENAITLDLCCGTGDIAKQLAKVTPEGSVYALDFSARMLNCAQVRCQDMYAPIHFLQGNAMKLPFPDTVFDAVTTGYGLRNVPHLEKCLEEVLRVLKPGGVFVSLDVGKVRIPLIAELNHFFFFYIVPHIGKFLYPGQEMFDYLPHSSVNYPNQESLKRIMLCTGFTQVDIHDFVFGASTVHVGYKP